MDPRRNKTDITSPQSAALGLHPVARRLLLINRPCRDGTLSSRWYSSHGLESNPRPRDRKSETVPLCSSSTTYIAFTARCTLVQSAVLRSHVVCLYVRPSDCLSVTLVNCDHIGWNSSKIIPLLVSLGRSLFATPTKDGCALRGTALNLGPNSSPLLI